MKKRLLFICQYFYPEVFRGNDIAFDMAKRGVDVTVICGTPNYPQGSFYNGYGWFKKTQEVINGVRIIRVPIIPRGTGNKIKLLTNYFSYCFAASIYLPFHILFNKRYDACFVQQLSPVMMSVPGVLFKKITGQKLYTWVLDLWPESLKAAGGIKNRHILDFFGLFAKLQYRNSDEILVSSKGFEKNINNKGPYSHKIHYFPNWAEDELKGCEKYPIPELPDGFKIIFTGNIGDAQDFESIIEAANIMSEDESVHFILVGDGRKKKWIEEQVKANHLENKIHLLGRFEIKYMPSFFDRADCLLLSLKDDEIMKLTVPAKMQAYMSSGKPVLAMINGDANDLVREVRCGISVPASTPCELVDAIRQLKNMSKYDLSAMGERGKKYCEENYSKDKLLSELYDRLFIPDK